MCDFKSRFFGELKPGLHFVLGTTNTGKTSVLMNDARDRSQHEPVEYINVDMNHSVLKQFFYNTGVRVNTFPYYDKANLYNVCEIISSTNSNYIYIDMLSGIMMQDDIRSCANLLDITIATLKFVANLRNKTIIITVNGNRSNYISGMDEEYANLIKKGITSIFNIEREERIISINGNKFELDQYRNLKEVVKKEQTLLEAVDIINEEINSIAIFPEDHSYGLVYKYVSGIEVVEYLGQTIYRSDIEERIYDEDNDEYESYESFLRRVVGEISKDVYSIFCKLTLDKMN
jgi:archaellum biogenesis ATPase FlaH